MLISLVRQPIVSKAANVAVKAKATRTEVGSWRKWSGEGWSGPAMTQASSPRSRPESVYQ